MAEQNIYNNTFTDLSTNNFWLTHPPPPLFTPPQSMTSICNLNFRMPFIYSHLSPNHNPAQMRSITIPYNNNSNISNLNDQDQYPSYNQNISNLVPSIPDNIDEEYILNHLCPVQKVPIDETNIWIKNWLASKQKNCTLQNVSNIEINEISNKIKECKVLLEEINNNKQFMEQNISIMTEIEWEKSCYNLLSVKERLNNIIKTLKFDGNSLSELKFKLSKRKKKRDRLRKLKFNLKVIKFQQKEEIREINRKIDTWQNTLKENIFKKIRANETNIEANIVLKGVREKIDDAKNNLLLIDTLEKLRSCRLQNCVNKRKNALLDESLDKLRIFWQYKLKDYYKEEEELKVMLSKSEAKKHEKRENEIYKNILKWDQVIFGFNFQSHDITFDNMKTFLDIRRGWDRYVINENEITASSSIPVGWIIPTTPCNTDWAKYLNIV